MDNILEQMDNVGREMEILGKNLKEMLTIKMIVTELKNDFDGLISGRDMDKERILSLKTHQQ